MTAAAPGPAGTAAQTTPPSTAGQAAQAVSSRTQNDAVAKPAGPPIARPPARKVPTPKLLRGWLIGTLLAIVAFTILGVSSLTMARGTLADAGESIEQLARVEQIRTDVLNADASAAHSFLGSADTPYREALADARHVLIGAATVEDQQTLQQVNRELDTYAAQLEAAWIGRGTPAGEAALTQAREHLRTVVLPALDTLVDDNSSRVWNQTSALHNDPLTLAGILSLAGLIGTTVVLSIRFRRVVNLGLVAALVLVVGSFFAAQWTLSNASLQVHDGARYEIQTFQASAAARGSAYNARSQEALALIQRAGDAAADAPWSAAAGDTVAALQNITAPISADLQASWGDYARAHAEVRAAAAAGNWNDAQRLAVSTNAQTAGGSFAAFDAQVTDTMTAASQDAHRIIEAPRAGLQTAAIGVGLGGIAAILCTWAGVRPRLREYR